MRTTTVSSFISLIINKKNLYNSKTSFCACGTEAYNRKKKYTHRAVHHARIDTKGLKTPDISFFNAELKAEVIIEVDERKSRTAAVKKAKHAIETHGVYEAFVYLTDTAEWLKISPAPDSKPSTVQDDYSEVLGLRLSKLVK